MCKCTPEIRTPFCGKPGCEWPKQNEEKKETLGADDDYVYKTKEVEGFIISLEGVLMINIILKKIGNKLFGFFARIFGVRAKTENSKGYVWKKKYYITKGYIKQGDMISYL